MATGKSSTKNHSKSTNNKAENHVYRPFNYKLPIKNIRKVNTIIKSFKIDCILANRTGGADSTLITVRSHLTENIHPGDILLGYDMRSVNLTCELQEIVEEADSIPDVILVKKKYKRGKRIWKLKHLEKEKDTTMKVNKNEEEKNANQYEEFLKEIEEDKPLRTQLNLYRDDAAIKELEGRFLNMKVEDIQKNENDPEIDIKVEELLDELTLDENKLQSKAIPLVDMKYDQKEKGNKKNKVTINKNKPSKEKKNEPAFAKPEKVKRTRAGEDVKDESEDDDEDK